MFVLDSHCDTPSQLKRLRDLSKDNDHAQVDFPKLKRGGVDGAFFALYTPASFTSENALAHARELLEMTEDSVRQNRDIAALGTSPSQALENKAKGLFSVFIGMENGSPIGESLDLLDDFYARGVRYMTLCHSSDNLICDSCADGNTWHGLSPFGREVVRRMNSLGMMIDVSHASDETFYDVLDCSEAPFVATHSCCRALAGHPRNMTDDMIRRLAARGGVIQINFYPVFLDNEFSETLSSSGLYDRGEAVEDRFIANPGDSAARKAWYSVLDELEALRRPSYRRIVDHIDHVVQLVGVEHVGLGSDFDGICVTPEGMEDAGCFHKIFEELSSRGYSDEDIAKVAGGNFLRVWNEIILRA